MNYRVIFLISIIILVSLSIANVVILSSGRIQIGTPVCDIFNDNSGTRCASIRCTGSAPSFSTCYDDLNIVTTLSEQSTQICELPPGGCYVIPTERLTCETNNKGATYGRNCGDVIQTITSRRIFCPLSCTCPNPIGEKPCRRATWNTDTCRWNDAVCYYVAGQCNGEPDYTQYPTSGCATGFVVGAEGFCTRSESFQRRCIDPDGYNPDGCDCPSGTSTSPIIIDVDGSGFSLTDVANGVDFDILALGFPQHISWTRSDSTNAFLVLDLNNSGTIDNGEELFGNVTPQPQNPHPNGFIALAVYDKTGNGGNGDGVINASDSVFVRLRLWQDKNHNAISEVTELHTLPKLDVIAVHLDYKDSKRTDEYGNSFRYRAKVDGSKHSKVSRWAWDVFVVNQP